MKTVYVPTPISELPIGPQQTYWTIDFGGAEGESRFDRKTRSWSSNVEFWLKPVPVSGVQSEEEIKKYVKPVEDSNEFEDGFSAGKQSAVEWTLSKVLPSLAALTAERDDYKNRATKAMTENSDLILENKALSEEMDRMKERIAELEAEDKTTHTEALDNAYKHLVKCDHPQECKSAYHDGTVHCSKCGCLISQFGEKIEPPYKL